MPTEPPWHFYLQNPEETPQKHPNDPKKRPTSGTSTGVSKSGLTPRRRSSLFDLDSASIWDALEQASGNRPVFEDTSRSKNASSSSRNVPVLLPEVDPTPQPHTRKVLLAVVTLIILSVVVIYYMLRHSERPYVTVRAAWATYRGFKKHFKGNPVFVFLGIRFGSNTSGQGRFRRAAPSGFMDVTAFDATKQGLPCTQSSMPTTLEVDTTFTATSEDCLHLNLWAPSLPSTTQTQKTVLVFFYGIAFKWGSNADHDASPLCALGDVIVVVPNYRLHALGFLGDGSEDAPGNLGLDDQLLALGWVKENIVSFGGNLSSIVPHGYEAGSISIGYHMVSRDDNLIKASPRLILQSGSLYRPLKENPKPSTVMKILGCVQSGWPCLRSMTESAYKMPEVYQSLDFEPNFHSPYLPLSLQLLIARNPIQGKQVLLGNVLEAGRFQVEQHKQELRHIADIVAEPLVTLYVKLEMNAIGFYGSDLDSLRRLYANDSMWPSEASADIASAILGHVFFDCPIQYLAEYLAPHGNAAYVYLWSHKPSFGPWAADEFGPTTYDDLAFVFGKPLLAETYATREEQELSRDTIALFTGFAKTGVLPKVEGKPWPQYSKEGPVTVEIRHDRLRLTKAYLAKRCSSLRKFIFRD